MKVPGLIRFFASHANAFNLLMALMVGAGLVSLGRINAQFFPTMEVPVISISIVWPGASAEDVESNIIEALEPELRFLDGVKELDATAREGSVWMMLEFDNSADMQKALSDVESAVASVTTLPKDMERPMVSRASIYEPIVNLAISGPFSESTLKAYAKRMRDDILNAGADRVSMSDAREEEIWIEVRPEELRRLDLTVGQIAARIASVSQDLPSGVIEGSFDRQVRSVGLAMDGEAIGAIEIKALGTGEKVLVRDIAVVKDTFNKNQPEGYRGEHRAIQLSIQRAGTSDTLKVAALVDTYFKKSLGTFPPELKIERFNVRSEYVSQRIGLLVKNALFGFFLVLLILFLFLNARVAIWVSVGIPVALTATFGLMYWLGLTIDMMSMFALMMTIGVIVDDAIVVGEYAATRREAGDSPVDAAMAGATRMFGPVLASSLTTMAAFLPILIVSGMMGEMMRAIPLVTVAVLIASLAECFLVLPGHLRGALAHPLQKSGGFRARFNEDFYRFRDTKVRAFVAWCYDWRYLTVATTVGVLVIALGLIFGGRVDFRFFPQIEAEEVSANVIMSQGTSREHTLDVLRSFEGALYRAEDKLTGGAGGLVKMAYITVGQTQGGHGGFWTIGGDNRGQLLVELPPVDMREVSNNEFIAAWKAEVPPIIGAERITVSSPQGGPPGQDLDIRLQNGAPDTLKAAALELRGLLERFPGVSDVRDDLPYGKEEVIIEVTPKGAAMGFTTESVGRQVRNAFQGAIAKRFARGDEEVTVRVRLSQDVESVQSLETLYLSAPDGREVPLTEVVSQRSRIGFSRINREDGVREVSVTGEIDADMVSAADVIASLSLTGLPEIAQKHGIDYAFKGRFEDMQETIGEMMLGTQLALLSIFIILAWVFGSYGRPFVVMAIIPFGLIGAVIGHIVMGYAMSVLGLIALLGLAGILVNNSIILVTQIDMRLDRGDSMRDAVIGGALDRFRPVVLTSLTTIGGLAPMMFETNLQAQFLMPMVITLVWGLATASALVLVVVPAILGIQEDVARRLGYGHPGATPYGESAPMGSGTAE